MNVRKGQNRAGKKAGESPCQLSKINCKHNTVGSEDQSWIRAYVSLREVRVCYLASYKRHAWVMTVLVFITVYR
jgi:hypothetical protein